MTAPWKQVDSSTGTYRRDLYGGEHLLAVFADSVEGFSTNIAAVTFTAPKESDALDSKLKTAWKALRFLSPLQAIKIVPVEGDRYEATYVSPATSDDLDSWVKETLLEHKSCQTSKDLVADIMNDKNALEGKMPKQGGYVTSLYYAKTAEQDKVHMCLVSVHACLDARGALLAFDHMLSTMATGQQGEMDWGTEATRLILPVSIATGLRTEGSATPPGFPEVMQAVGAQQASSAPTAALPALKTKAQSAGVATNLVQAELPASVVDRIHSAAKEHKLGFSYAVGAVIALVAYRKSTNAQEAKTVVFPLCPADQRYRLADSKEPIIANFVSNAGATYISVPFLQEGERELAKNKTLGEGFWKAVAEIDAAWGAGKYSDLAVSLEHEFATLFSGIARSTPEQFLLPTFMYSPIGVVETILKPEYGNLQVPTRFR